jgi:hypothetical protein
MNKKYIITSIITTCFFFTFCYIITIPKGALYTNAPLNIRIFTYTFGAISGLICALPYYKHHKKEVK